MNNPGAPHESVDFPLARLLQNTEWTPSLSVRCRINNIVSEEDLKSIESCKTNKEKVVRFYDCLEKSPSKINLLIITLRAPTVRMDAAAKILQEFLVASPSGLQSTNPPSNEVVASPGSSTFSSRIDATPIPRCEIGSERRSLSGESSSGSSSPVTMSPQGESTPQEGSKLPALIEANIRDVINKRVDGGDCYSLPPEEGPAGHALLINIDEFEDPNKLRKGAKGDTTNMGQVLKHFKFEVETLPAREATFEGINLRIKEFQEKCKIEKSRSCIVAVMSHGDTTNPDSPNTSDIVTYDGKNMPTDSIVNKFNNTNFSALKGKPKVFFFQFCRGRIVDRGESPPPAESDGGDGSTNTGKSSNVARGQDTLPQIPSWTDILICYSTMRGHFSYRDPNDGSHFIQTIAAVIKEKAHECHICEIMDIVAECMKLLSIRSKHEEVIMDVKQICPYENIGFNKKFYLCRPAAAE